MKHALTALAFIASTTPTLAQDPLTNTKALVNMVVAEQFCKIDAPISLVDQIGDASLRETGLDHAQTADAAYRAAAEIGMAHTRNGTLVDFCLGVAQVYGKVR